MLYSLCNVQVGPRTQNLGPKTTVVADSVHTVPDCHIYSMYFVKAIVGNSLG
jgi:hypothetical protein